MKKEKLQILLATGNEGKIREIKYILSKISEEIGREIEVVLPEKKPEIPEKGKTYFENALAKATWWKEKENVNIPILAEDSGIEIFAFGESWPGIMSSRIPHPESTDKDRCIYILHKLEGKKDRRARYVSWVVLLVDNIWFADWGKTEGKIAEKMIGEGGFGYDPIFWSQDLGKTFGEATVEEKSSVSHRARALWKFKKLFENL